MKLEPDRKRSQRVFKKVLLWEAQFAYLCLFYVSLKMMRREENGPFAVFMLIPVIPVNCGAGIKLKMNCVPLMFCRQGEQNKALHWICFIRAQ